MRAARTNTPARFDIPGGSCDAHFHVFEPGYSSIPQPFYSFPEGTIAQYLALTDFFGIDRMVLVQPTYYATETSLTTDALRRLGPRARGVVRVEEDVSDATLDAYHEIGVRAFRLDLFERSELPEGGARHRPGMARAVLLAGHRRPRSAAVPRRARGHVRDRPHGLHDRKRR